MRSVQESPRRFQSVRSGRPLSSGRRDEAEARRARKHCSCIDHGAILSVGRYSDLIAELRRELLRHAPSLAEGLPLDWPDPKRRLRRERALRFWNYYWIALLDERPDLFHSDVRSSLIDTQALAYLFVRAQYPAAVPPLRLEHAERQQLDELRTQFRRWSGLAALSAPPRYRLVRRDCPVLVGERRAFSPERAACTFAWSPGPVRRTVVVYEKWLETCRAEGEPWLMVPVLLHEEIHGAHQLAAGRPQPYADDDRATPLIEELCTTLQSNVAELVVLHGRAPSRRQLMRWNDLSYRGEQLNGLVRLWPDLRRGDEIVAAAAALAVSAIGAGDEGAVLELLAAPSSRRGVAAWRRLLLG